MEVTVTVERMSEEEARACVDQIKQNLENVRERLFELRERDGWESLGYPTFQACIQAEFNMSERHAHRLLNAHAVDRILSAPWQESTAFFGKVATPAPRSTGPIPERHARELEPLMAEPEAVREVYAEAHKRTNGQPTAAVIREVVDERISFRALLARDLDSFIRASRSTEVAGAAELEQIGRLQRRLTKEFVIFYGVDGKPVRKLLRDVRMDELPKIVDYYRRQARGMTRRADRYEALHQQMSLRGCAASDLVCKLVV